ncbi:MAG: DUF6056 family protein [Prevotella sp.]|jgi:hypothetical protein|nr:DUF6056 family protein [Prevotella sp.]
MEKQKTDKFDRMIAFVRSAYDKIEASSGRNSALLWVVAVLLSFSAIFILNILTPLISDDFAYMFVYGEDRLVSSVADILHSQENHYYMWGGRSVVHFIAQVLLILPPYVADLLNSLVYMGYIFLIYLHIKGRGRNSLSLFVLVNLAVWFLQPVLGDTVFWITGAANYLWGTALILLFLLPFRMYQGQKSSIASQILMPAGIFICGIIAGWTNENTAGAMLLISILFCAYYYSQKWDIPVWSVTGFIGSLSGFFLMIAAPGNYVRAGDSSFDLLVLAYRLFSSTQTLLFYCSPLLLVALLMYVIFYRFPDKNRNDNLKLSLIYTIAAITAVYAMVLSPTFPRRALFGVVTYLITGIGILFNNLDFRHSFIRQARMLIITFGLFCFLFTFYFAFKEINSFRNIVQEREFIIKQAKEDGKPEYEFDRFSGGIYIHGEDPFSAELMSRYYGIKIKLVPPRD